MTPIFCFASFLVAANAQTVQDTVPAEIRVMEPGEWTTSSDWCGAGCVKVTNSSKTRCVAFGMRNPLNTYDVIDATVMWRGAAVYEMGVYTAGGKWKDCLPPGESVYGHLDGYTVADFVTIRYKVPMLPPTGPGKDPKAVYNLDVDDGVAIETYNQTNTNGDYIAVYGTPGNPNQFYYTEGRTSFRIGD